MRNAKEPRPKVELPSVATCILCIHCRYQSLIVWPVIRRTETPVRPKSRRPTGPKPSPPQKDPQPPCRGVLGALAKLTWAPQALIGPNRLLHALLMPLFASLTAVDALWWWPAVGCVVVGVRGRFCAAAVIFCAWAAH